MKKQLLISLILAFGLTTIAQPSFAMKRNRPGNTADQMSSMISSLSLLLAVSRVVYNNIIMLLENDDPCHYDSHQIYDPSDPQTWVPHDGVSYDPQTGEPQLTLDDTEEANPFPMLPDDAIILIFAQVGPQGRTQCWSVNKNFRQLLKRVQGPNIQGGFGWTDTLPVVASIAVGLFPSEPVVYGEKLYVGNRGHHTVSVIDTNTNMVVATIPVGRFPWQPVVHGQKLYVVNTDDNTVSVIDTNTDMVVATIPVGRCPMHTIFHGQMLCVLNFNDSTISVIDTNTNHVVATIPLGHIPMHSTFVSQMLRVVKSWDSTISPIDTNTNQVGATIGHMLYKANRCSSTVNVIDARTSQVVATIGVGKDPLPPVVHGNMLYVVSCNDGRVFVIDTNTNQVVHIIQVKGKLTNSVGLGNMLYVSVSRDSDDDEEDEDKDKDELAHRVCVINLGGYLPGQH